MLHGLVCHQVNFDGTDFTGADIGYAHMSVVSCVGARFDRTYGRKVNFIKATLVGTSFVDSVLVRGHFSYCHMDAADLTNADLRGAFIYKTRLDGARLHNIWFERAAFHNVSLIGSDLRGARFIEPFQATNITVGTPEHPIVLSGDVAKAWLVAAANVPMTDANGQ